MAKKIFKRGKGKGAEQGKQQPCEQDDGWVPEEIKRPVLDNYVEIVKMELGGR